MTPRRPSPIAVLRRANLRGYANAALNACEALLPGEARRRGRGPVRRAARPALVPDPRARALAVAVQSARRGKPRLVPGNGRRRPRRI